MVVTTTDVKLKSYCYYIPNNSNLVESTTRSNEYLITNESIGSYHFDYCHEYSDDTHNIIPEAIITSCNVCLLGFNTCILVMQNYFNKLINQQELLICSIIDTLQNLLDKNSSKIFNLQSYEIMIECYEIFDNKIRDLLDLSTPTYLSTSLRTNQSGISIENLKTITTNDLFSMKSVLSEAIQRRIVLVYGSIKGSTDKTSYSNEFYKEPSIICNGGHLFINIKIQQFLNRNDCNEQINRQSTIQFVSLASSDTLNSCMDIIVTNNQSYQIVPMQFIDFLNRNSKYCVINDQNFYLYDNLSNKLSKDKTVSAIQNSLKSLSTLVRVVRNIIQYKQVDNNTPSSNIHIPYRDNVLTRLLQSSLSGNCCMFLLLYINLNINGHEKLLRFASEISKLSNQIKVNEVYTNNAHSKQILTDEKLSVSSDNKTDSSVDNSTDSEINSEYSEINGEIKNEISTKFNEIYDSYNSNLLDISNSLDEIELQRLRILQTLGLNISSIKVYDNKPIVSIDRMKSDIIYDLSSNKRIDFNDSQLNTLSIDLDNVNDVNDYPIDCIDEFSNSSCNDSLTVDLSTDYQSSQIDSSIISKSNSINEKLHLVDSYKDRSDNKLVDYTLSIDTYNSAESFNHIRRDQILEIESKFISDDFEFNANSITSNNMANSMDNNKSMNESYQGSSSNRISKIKSKLAHNLSTNKDSTTLEKFKTINDSKINTNSTDLIVRSNNSGIRNKSKYKSDVNRKADHRMLLPPIQQNTRNDIRNDNKKSSNIKSNRPNTTIYPNAGLEKSQSSSSLFTRHIKNDFSNNHSISSKSTSSFNKSNKSKFIKSTTVNNENKLSIISQYENLDYEYNSLPVISQYEITNCTNAIITSGDNNIDQFNDCVSNNDYSLNIINNDSKSQYSNTNIEIDTMTNDVSHSASHSATDRNFDYNNSIDSNSNSIKVESLSQILNDHLKEINQSIESNNKALCSVELYNDIEIELSELESKFLRYVVTGNIDEVENCILISKSDKLSHRYPSYNIVTYVKNSFDRDAMQLVARNGHLPMLKLLFHYGGKLNSRGPRGDTLLHLACYYGHIPIIEYLVKRGLSTKLIDHFGQSIVHVACHRGELDTLKYLYNHFEDLDFCLPDYSGRTPIECIPNRGGYSSCGSYSLEDCRQFMTYVVGMQTVDSDISDNRSSSSSDSLEMSLASGMNSNENSFECKIRKLLMEKARMLDPLCMFIQLPCMCIKLYLNSLTLVIDDCI